MKSPLLKRLGPDREISKLPVPMAIDLSFVTSAKAEDAAILEKVLELAVQDVLKRFERDGFKTYIREGLVRPITKEELLSILPRKTHMGWSGDKGWLCDTPHVAARNISFDEQKVTCRSCLKKLGG